MKPVNCNVNSYAGIEADFLLRVVGCLISVELADSRFLDSHIPGNWNGLC